MPTSPETWSVVPLGELLDRVVRPVRLEADQQYQEIGIRSHCKGIFHKKPVTGKQIGSKRVFWIEPGCLTFNIIFAWEQAIALTTAKEAGMIASHRFPMYRSANGKLIPEYVHLYFSSPRGKHDLALASPGGAGRNKTLGQEEFKRIKIPLPPISRQKQIVAIIQTWDRAIRQANKLIAAKQRLKRGLMQQLLTGERRFPEFVNGRRPKETKWGPIPADWDIVHLEDVAAINQRALPDATDPARSFYYVDLSAIKDGAIRKSSHRIDFAHAPSRARRLATRGDIVMTTVRPNLQGFALPAFDLADFVFSTGFAIISPQREGDSDFLYHSLYSDVVTRQLHGLIAGSSYPAITGKDVGRLRLCLPSSPRERVKIGRVLTVLSHEINLLCRYLRQLGRQKRGLMQKLLSGQIRTT